MATLTRVTGFEHGTALVAGVGNGLADFIAAGSPSVQSTYVRSGNYGLQLDAAIVGYQLTTSAYAVYSMWFMVRTLPAAAAKGAIANLFGNTRDVFFRVKDDGNGACQLIAEIVNDSTSAVIATQNGPIVPINTWHQVDFQLFQNSTTWTIDWYIDGVLQTQVAATGQTATTGAKQLYIGDTTGSLGIVVDDLAYSVTNADFPIGSLAIFGATADQNAAAEHQSTVAAEIQYTDDFSSFTNFASTTETDSRSRIDDLSTGDGVRLRGAATAWTLPTLRANGAKSAGTTGAVTVSAPVGVATGDLEVMAAVTIDGGSVSITNNGGSAWTAMPNTPVSATGARKLYVWYRIRQAGDGDPQVTAGSDFVCASRTAYTTGTFDTTTPISDATAGTETTSDTSLSFAPGYNTPTDNCLVACIASIANDSNTGQVPVMANTSLTSLTLRNNISTNSGSGGGFGWTDGTKATAGTSGTFTVTYGASSPKTYVAFTIRGIPSGWGALTGNARWPVAAPLAPAKTAPIAVSLTTASRESAAGTDNATFRTLVGGSTTNHFSADPGWGTTWNYLHSVMNTAPSGSAWAYSDVSAIKFEADSSDADPAIYLGGFFYEIAFRDTRPVPPVVVNQAVQRMAVR